MNVLFQNRAKDTWTGGDMVQLERTSECLKTFGVNTAFNPGEELTPKDYAGFDIVHLFNFSMPWTAKQVMNAKAAGKPVVCSMIYHERDDFVTYKVQQIMADVMDAFIFITEEEAERAKRHLTIPEAKIHFVPNGIDGYWFADFPKCSIPYVLTVGRLEPSKNQLRVAKACKNLSIPYINVGAYNGSDYTKVCRDAGAVLYGNMSQSELPVFYSGCSVFVLASHREVMPLTVMEAGAQAKNIVLTNGCGWKVPNAEYVDWQDDRQIEDAIRVSLEKEPNEDFRTMLKPMTWENTALSVKRIYDGL